MSEGIYRAVERSMDGAVWRVASDSVVEAVSWAVLDAIDDASARAVLGAVGGAVYWAAVGSEHHPAFKSFLHTTDQIKDKQGCGKRPRSSSPFRANSMSNLETAWAVWGVMGGDLVVVAAYSSDRKKLDIVTEALIEVYRAESEISRSIDLVEDYPPHPALQDFLSVSEPPRVET